MDRAHRASIWTAALTALCGTLFICAFFLSIEPRIVILESAEVAASIGAAALVLSVVFVCRLARRSSPGNGDRESNAELESLRNRQQVITRRLDIDDPRTCARYLIRCTCWSLCSGTSQPASRCSDVPARPGERAATSAGEPECPGMSSASPCANVSEDCPFRFESRVMPTRFVAGK